MAGVPTWTSYATSELERLAVSRKRCQRVVSSGSMWGYFDIVVGVVLVSVVVIYVFSSGRGGSSRSERESPVLTTEKLSMKTSTGFMVRGVMPIWNQSVVEAGPVL